MNDDVERPEVKVLGDVYRFRWLSFCLEAEVSRFVEHRESLVADVLIAVIADGGVRKLIHRSTLNLKAGETRGRLAKQLTERRQDVPWATVLEQLCFLAIDTWQEGKPSIDLRTVDPLARPRWFLRPYLEHGGPTVLFAPGGSGKSYLAMAAAITIASGRSLFGALVGAPGPVLYLDWETDQFTHAERLRAICRGAGIHELPPIYYRHMVGALLEALPAVQRECAELGIVAAIVDSLATARGGEPESAEQTNKAMTGVRGLGLPTLIVDHVSKAVMQAHERSGRLSPFGSIYTENRARNTWSVRRAGEEASDDFVVALIHEKTNNGRYQPRHAYKLAFTNVLDQTGEEHLEAMRLQTWNIADVVEFETELALPQRILNYLRRQEDGTATPEEFAEASGKPLGQIRPRFSELAGKGKIVRLPDRRRYGLMAGDER